MLMPIQIFGTFQYVTMGVSHTFYITLIRKKINLEVVYQTVFVSARTETRVSHRYDTRRLKNKQKLPIGRCYQSI